MLICWILFFKLLGQLKGTVHECQEMLLCWSSTVSVPIMITHLQVTHVPDVMLPCRACVSLATELTKPPCVLSANKDHLSPSVCSFLSTLRCPCSVTERPCKAVWCKKPLRSDLTASVFVMARGVLCSHSNKWETPGAHVCLFSSFFIVPTFLQSSALKSSTSLKANVTLVFIKYGAAHTDFGPVGSAAALQNRATQSLKLLLVEMTFLLLWSSSLKDDELVEKIMHVMPENSRCEDQRKQHDSMAPASQVSTVQAAGGGVGGARINTKWAQIKCFSLPECCSHVFMTTVSPPSDRCFQSSHNARVISKVSCKRGSTQYQDVLINVSYSC